MYTQCSNFPLYYLLTSYTIFVSSRMLNLYPFQHLVKECEGVHLSKSVKEGEHLYQARQEQEKERGTPSETNC